MYKEQNILLNETNIKYRPKKYKIGIKRLKNILNKRKNLKVGKSIKIQKNLKTIILTIIFVIFIIAMSLIIRKAIRITNSNKKYKNYIPIAFSLNDNYVYPLIVLLTSILYNSCPDTFYLFYLLLHPDLQETKIKKILGVKDKYQNCKFELIHMGNNYSNYPKGYNKSAAIYYRLDLPDLITDRDKIIYLDVDTIVHKDLTDMYNIDMGIYYYMGIPDHDINNFEFNGKRNFINSGVLLINLKNLREVNSTILYRDYYDKHGTLKVDEYLINAVFYNNISFLPFIYGLPDIGAGSDITVSTAHYCNEFHFHVNCTEYDMDLASKNRAITHNCYEEYKWWQKNYTNLTDIGKQWLFYASKSNVFDEICKKYNQFESQCEILKKENK